ADAGFEVNASTLGTFQAAQVFVIPALCASAGVAIDIREIPAAQAALELNVLGAIREHQPARIERQAAVQGELWQPIVGCDAFHRGALIGMDRQASRVTIDRKSVV